MTTQSMIDSLNRQTEGASKALQRETTLRPSGPPVKRHGGSNAQELRCDVNLGTHKAHVLAVAKPHYLGAPAAAYVGRVDLQMEDVPTEIAVALVKALEQHEKREE